MILNLYKATVSHTEEDKSHRVFRAFTVAKNFADAESALTKGLIPDCSVVTAIKVVEFGICHSLNDEND